MAAALTGRKACLDQKTKASRYSASPGRFITSAKEVYVFVGVCLFVSEITREL